MSHSTVLILDFGSQYTQLIARRVREMGIYSLIQPAGIALTKIQEMNPRAIILSGGPSSVYDPGTPTLEDGFFDYQKKSKVPVLGICYGMQLLMHKLGGKVERASVREYGRMLVEATGESKLLGKSFQAWMSHGDETRELPSGFQVTARSATGSLAAVENADAKLFGLQFHPEVTHTERGQSVLEKFLKSVSGIQPDWDMGSVREEQIAKIRAQVGPDRHAICALSGGVDSAVAAMLVHEALGDRLHCVFVDNGLLRYQEQERVMSMFREHLHLPVTCVDASEKFLNELKGVTDPEQKRKIIGAQFISVFDQSAEKLSSKIGHTPEFLIQGTLYPDVIESSPAPQSGGVKHSTTIKSHHNVGGLPKDLKFKLIEPLRDLFKDEVRELGKVLGVPKDFLKRHPFPGPGLAVRVIGEITPERLKILRHVDEIFIRKIRDHGLYDQIWQAFAVFLPIKSVGVQGDGRTHDHVVALRAVSSSDGMTADWFHFDGKVLADISTTICNSVPGVNRVVYDISSKPPATIEWE